MDPKKRRRVQTLSGALGKEELRAAVLKPYLLHLRNERDEKAVLALLATAGIPPAVLDDETSWISVGAARRALRALADALGDEALAHRGAWMTHPQTLGSYVNLLRVASSPVDAYRYVSAHAEEMTRVGRYTLEGHQATSLRMVYRPREDQDVDQSDRLLCLARRSELAAIPLLWGLDEATVRHEACLADGADRCEYDVSWRAPGGRRTVALLGAAACVLTGSAVAISGNWTAAAIAAAAGGGLGAVIGFLTERGRREATSRTFEKNRIAALERGLELRGQASRATATGELTGAVLGGKYRITRRIGSGGIGAVYAAEHVALGSTVAVKVLRGAAADDAAEIARLRREAQVQVSIEHPNVVRTLDLDQMPDGSIYVVMEMLRGRTVADHLRTDGLLAPGYAIPVFMQVCRALQAAHDLGIVHRDMKPGNVFLCDDGTVKVVDFGMSKFAEAEVLTQEGYTLGTPEYMSPEQCIGAPVEPRTDLYAFGVLMYESLTGALPLQARQRRDLLELHQREIPRSMLEVRPDLPIPRGLDDAVMACLRKRAAERPKNARELERMLAAVPPDGLPRSYPEEIATQTRHNAGARRGEAAR